LVKIFKSTGIEVFALQGLDLSVDQGELMAIVGASGSGKSTLLSILSGLDQPTAGKASVAGYDLLNMSGSSRLRYRREVVGFIYQQTGSNLLPYLNAYQNVEVPLQAAGVRGSARRQRTAELLNLLGLTELSSRLPSELSGGQQQRVAIAVALAGKPKVIFADEPTGELDSATASEVLDAFRHVNRELGVTVVIVTHDPDISSKVDRTVAIRDGRTASEVIRAHSHLGDKTGGVEFAVLDSVGRLQLPEEMVVELGLSRRVVVALKGDHIEIWPESKGFA
jgi:ABC-type lipoprotein export system ATPase subunit